MFTDPEGLATSPLTFLLDKLDEAAEKDAGKNATTSVFGNFVREVGVSIVKGVNQGLRFGEGTTDLFDKSKTLTERAFAGLRDFGRVIGLLPQTRLARIPGSKKLGNKIAGAAAAKVSTNVAAKNVAGISAAEAQKLRSLLEAVPGVEKVRVFGSRTRGTLSDLDVLLIGKRINLKDPATRSALLEAQKFARKIGIGTLTGRKPVLDINTAVSRIQFLVGMAKAQKKKFSLRKFNPFFKKLE